MHFGGMRVVAALHLLLCEDANIHPGNFYLVIPCVPLLTEHPVSRPFLRTCLLLLSFLFISRVYAQSPHRVLMIGIDGCRPDALMAANTPTLDSLMSSGTFSLHARTIYPTWSGPGWSSMLTGVWYTKHGVTDNTFSGANFTSYPHFFNRVEAFDSSLYTASICQWAPVNDYIVNLADLISNPGLGIGVATTAANLLSAQDPDVVFLHFDDVDHEGHASGFSPTNPLYLSAIEGVDGHVRTVLKALRARPTFALENWLVLVSTDHGGIGTSHGGNTEEEKTIFLILSGGGLPVQELTPLTTNAPLTPSIQLDGSTQYGSASALPAYDFGTSTDFTVECRIQTNGWSGDPAIVSDKDWNSGLNPGFVIAARSDGYGWKANIGDGANRIDLNGGTISDGRPHQLALTVERNGYARLFQDGALVDSVDASLLGAVGTGFPLAVGQDGTLNYPNYFQGAVDEVRLWNTAVDPTTLSDWTCRSLDATHPNAANLIGHWQFDENTGTTAQDASTNANALQLIGAPLWQTISLALVCTDDSDMPRMVDIVPIVLDHLCIPVQPSWQLDGATPFSLCTTTGFSAATTPATSSLLFPNPANNRVTIRFGETESPSCRVVRLTGERVAVPVIRKGERELTLDCSQLPPWIYLVEVRSGDRVEYHRLVRQ